MDVIALAEAGFGATVAPLGTAITEDQLQLLWRMADEPIIALDGDTAGLRAAMRVIDVALPLVESGKSLRFALMPDGLDPDDLIKTQGAGAMRKVIDGAIPMVQLLWQREVEGKVFDSPERKAALDKALREKIKLIRDPSIRNHYGQAIKDLRWALFSNKGAPVRQGQRRQSWSAAKDPWKRDLSPVAASRASALAAGVSDENHLREAVILAALISAPAVALAFETDLERLESRDPAHRALQSAILRHLGTDDLKAKVVAECGGDALEKLMSQSHVRISPAIRHQGNDEIARLCLAEEFAKLTARRGHQREIEDAIQDLDGVADEGLTWRLAQASEAVNRAGRGNGEDKVDYAIGENGARMKKEERSAFDELLQKIDFAKGRKDTN
jgi:DNA primase